MNSKVEIVSHEELARSVDQHSRTNLDPIHKELDRILDLIVVLGDRDGDVWANMSRPDRIEHTLGGTTKLIYD